LFVWAKFVNVPEGATEIEVVGRQWHWSFRLPGKDGEFGTVDAKLFSVENPFGIDPDDPNGHDDVLVDEAIVHIPLGEPVRFWLRSKDVLHNFTVAQFRVKMDLVPGSVSYMWLEPTKVGEYEVLCEELCGIAHHAMRGRVVVDEPEDYQAWVDSQPTFAEIRTKAPGDPALGAASYAVCAACHGAQGQGQEALHAPKLSGQEPRYLRRQLRNYQLGRRGASDGDVYGQQMAPMAATLMSDAIIDNVVAYIGTFPDTPAPATIDGDVAHGAKLYVLCANCHGDDGQGIPMNAPRQAGMSDWYLLDQLKNFKQGLRGHDPEDLEGKQMAFMARTLQDEQAMRDVIAYINTL
jgi:cytochrome c oxidase subunit 2